MPGNRSTYQNDDAFTCSKIQGLPFLSLPNLAKCDHVYIHELDHEGIHFQTADITAKKTQLYYKYSNCQPYV